MEENDFRDVSNEFSLVYEQILVFDPNVNRIIIRTQENDEKSE